MLFLRGLAADPLPARARLDTMTIPKAIRAYARPQSDASTRPGVDWTLRDLHDPEAELTRHVRVPSPQHVTRNLVARHLADVGPAYRTSEGLRIRRDGDLVELPPAACRELIAELFASMPERVVGLREWGRSDVYRGLYAFIRLAAPDDLAAYINAIVAAVPASLPQLPAPTSKPERPPAKTAAERKAAYLARRAERERAMVAAFLADRDGWADDISAELVPRSELLALLATWTDTAVEDFDAARADYRSELAAYELDLGRYDRELARWRGQVDGHDTRRDGPRPPRPIKPATPADPWPDEAAENGYPPHPVTVGPRRAIAIFRELGVAEVRRADGHYHRLGAPAATPATPAPREDADTMSPETIHTEADAYARAADEAERLIAARDALARQQAALAVGDLRGALTAQRERLDASPDASIVDLAAYRARKAA